MSASLSLRVRVSDELLDLPLSQLSRVALLDRIDWRGYDDLGRPLCLARSDDGPLVVLSAPELLDAAQASPLPRWAVVPRAAQAPDAALRAAAVCDLLGVLPDPDADADADAAGALR